MASRITPCCCMIRIIAFTAAVTPVTRCLGDATDSVPVARFFGRDPGNAGLPSCLVMRGGGRPSWKVHTSYGISSYAPYSECLFTFISSLPFRWSTEGHGPQPGLPGSRPGPVGQGDRVVGARAGGGRGP